MLRIANFWEIQETLLRVTPLINRMEQREVLFFDEAKSWFVIMEQILINNRMTIAGNVAALRGTLISAERGFSPAGFVVRGRPTERKIRDAIVADALRSASDLIFNAIREDGLRFDEAERLCRQIVALAKSKGIIVLQPIDVDHTQYLKEVWKTISADSDIAPGAIRVEGLVGPYDMLIVLDRIITTDVNAN